MQNTKSHILYTAILCMRKQLHGSHTNLHNIIIGGNPATDTHEDGTRKQKSVCLCDYKEGHIHL